MAKYRQKSCQICEEPNCDGNILHTFVDGHRQVDFVLAYPKSSLNEKHRQKREMFCQNLELEGLELEYDSSHAMQQFIKIHVPQNVLIRYSEVLKFRMPIREKYLSEVTRVRNDVGLWKRVKTWMLSPFQCVELQRHLKPGTEFKVYHEFERNKEFLFDMHDSQFFSQSVRISIASYILERTRFTGILDVSNLSRNVVGIEKLLQDKVFRAAFPLHDGDLSEQQSKRHLLLEEWASLKHWMRYQPLDEIKDYFGAQIALYFAWIGYYSQMLIIPSVFGIICVLFGLSTMFINQISKEICSGNNTIVVCPQCDEQCDYWRLNETCLYSRSKNMFDNRLTVIFAIFMSLWATVYLELWKRYSTRLVHNWGLTNYKRRGEHPRPQYLSKLKNVKHVEVNVDTLMKEPKLTYWRSRFPRYFLSYTTIMLLITLSIIAIGSIIVFRMATIQAQNFYEKKKHSMTYQSLLLPATTAIIDLILITMLNYAYKYLAIVLTNLELKRTQIEYDESVSIKIYLFQFVNFYSSMFYISFIKGKLVGYPAKYNRIFGLRQEECNPGGCMTELCIELAVFMIGKQVINAVVENLVPFVKKTYNKIVSRTQKSKKRFSVVTLTLTHTQWEEDYSLLKWESQFIYKEHLELVIQFGFVMLFIVAFPLSPLLALINNVFEMRLDAKKYLLYFRRPVPKRVKDIGHWNHILQMICRMSVITNAILIAFSSDFIPQMVYQNFYSHSGSYLNFTYSAFNVTDFQEGAAPLTTQFKDLEICHYESFRNGPNVEPKYKKSLIYWQILAVRVIFVVLYQNVVSTVRLIVDCLIPKVPGDVKKDEKWGENLLSTIVLNQGLEMIDLGNNN